MSAPRIVVVMVSATMLLVIQAKSLSAQDAKGKIGAMTTEQCTDLRSHWRPDSTLKGVKLPEPTQKLVLPTAPRDDAGKEIELKLLVTEIGGVDSVRARGTMSSTYEERLQVVMKRYRFKPASYQGCAVPYWLTFQVTP